MNPLRHTPTQPLSICLALVTLAGCALVHDRGGAPLGPPMRPSIPAADAGSGDARPSATVTGPGEVIDCESDLTVGACIGPNTNPPSEPEWVWDGSECVVPGANAFYSNAYRTQDECARDHAHCDAVLCVATGGTWFPWDYYCGHHNCTGEPRVRDNTELCPSLGPACRCASNGELFVPGRGCEGIADCTGSIPEPGSDEDLCVSTGGSWGPNCGHAHCGNSNLACAAPACDCPTDGHVFRPGPIDTHMFAPEHGCILSLECPACPPGYLYCDTPTDQDIPRCYDAACDANGAPRCPEGTFPA